MIAAVNAHTHAHGSIAICCGTPEQRVKMVNVAGSKAVTRIYLLIYFFWGVDVQ